MKHFKYRIECAESMAKELLTKCDSGKSGNVLNALNNSNNEFWQEVYYYAAIMILTNEID